MGAIMDGHTTPAQIAALAASLRTKGETVREVEGFARAMRKRSLKVSAPRKPVADTCGTGGDGKGTLNISTAAALVAAGAGVLVAKHGNRAMSSKTGSADVLGALGVKVDSSPADVEASLKSAGIGFMFAQVFHPAMKHAGPVRREMGIRTIFNLLGPLTNPAAASAQLIGVGAASVLDLEARTLAALGTGHSLVVHSEDGLDEVTTTAPVRCCEVRGRRVVRSFVLEGKKLGFAAAKLSDLKGGEPAENAAAIRRLLDGEHSAFRDSVVLSAGIVCWLAEAARDLKSGIALSVKALDSGAARTALGRLASAVPA